MSETKQHGFAVVFVCDKNYVRFALFMIRQIAHHNPDRSFDFVIYSPDEISLPDWARPWDIKTVRAQPLVDLPKSALWRGTTITFHRFGMVRDLQSRYRRIIQMDCDMFVEGGDFDRLFRADLGGHPVAAALDAQFFVSKNAWVREYQMAGLPAAPYFNCGFQLIDTQAYVEQEVEKRAYAACRDLPQAITTADQSAVNLALKGKFAQLSPAWNWQRSIGLPLVTMRFPVFVRHFIDQQKPDRDSTGVFDPRFNLAYREFFGRYDPEYLPQVAPPCDPAPIGLGDLARLVWWHVMLQDTCRTIIRRYPDPYQILI